MKDLANLEKFDKRNVFLEKMIKIINKDRKLKNNMFLKCLGKHRTKPNSGKVKLNYRIKEWDIDFYNFIKDIKNKFNNKSIIICGDLNVITEKIDIYNFDYSNDIDIRVKESDNFLNNKNFVDCFRF